ncbi:K(+)-transporting ATPase subunit F [Streptomyces sp. CA-106110]
MSIENIVGVTVAGCLMVYLICCLIVPERF